MEKLSNQDREGKAFKFKPHWKSLQIKTAMEKSCNWKPQWKSLQILAAVEKPSNKNRAEKAFKTKNRDGKALMTNSC